ncbi:MAG: S8 family peptidase [Luteibaculum sp.]
MKKFKSIVSLALASAVLFLGSCSKDIQNPSTTEQIAPDNETVQKAVNAPIEDQYIVVLKETAVPQQLLLVPNYLAKLQMVYDVAKGLLATIPGGSDVALKNVYAEVFPGFAAQLTATQKAALEALPQIAFIEQDQIMSIIGSDPKATGSSAQADEKPYGILRTGHASGAGKTAYVIDTGIDLDHPDLNVNTELSKDFTGNTAGCGLLGILFGCPDQVGSPDDGNGHGTHCAGTIAAKSNGSGVLGVAFDATVVAIKVLGDNGSGSNSGVIQGVDYVASTASRGDVANMSLGGGASSALDNAVRNAASRGILFALAAGNDSRDANSSSPARANGSNIYTVSAMNSSDRFANFSNFGNPPVDFCAPGVSVKSTYRNGGYATLSGTSMAAPHVAGILLLRGGAPLTDGFVINDPDGTPDPIAHL